MIGLWLLVLLIIVVVRGTDGLSSVTQQQQKPIQRVGIVGGGIAGLTLAHALLPNDNNNNDVKVEVFDARKDLDFEAGAGVQINGGMSVLHRINPRLQQAVVRASLPLTEIESRSRPWFPNTQQTTYDTLLQIGLDQTIRNANDETKQALIVNDQVMAYTIMRGALQETLLNELPPETQERVRFGKMLTGIRGTTSSSSNNKEEEDGGIMLDFQDGSSAGPFDLVVGCDGIKTAVKEYIETGRISADPKQRKGSPAIYSGIRIRYAVQDANDDDDKDDKDETTAQLRQYFGNGGYALTGIYGAGPNRPPVNCAFTIVLDDDYIGPFKKKEEEKASSSTVVEENVSWTQDVRGSNVVRDIMLQQIADCEIPDLELRPIVSGASRFFELGVYFHIPFSLKGWSQTVPRSGGRFCTLCGDAAHAMPPFLGQGSNQGIQDAYCLAQAILEFNNNHQNNDDGQKTLKEILKEYEQVRWAATTEISAKAAVLGYIEAGPGFVAKFRDTLFFTLGKLGIAQKVFLGAATPKVDR